MNSFWWVYFISMAISLVATAAMVYADKTIGSFKRQQSVVDYMREMWDFVVIAVVISVVPVANIFFAGFWVMAAIDELLTNRRKP
jgi:hypothetical protein